MTETIVCMDNCGLQTKIEAELSDDGKVNLKITSNCKSIKELSEELTAVDPFRLCGQQIINSEIYIAASKFLRHAACAVPPAIVRAVEVESGMALPGETLISTSRK